MLANISEMMKNAVVRDRSQAFIVVEVNQENTAANQGCVKRNETTQVIIQAAYGGFP